MSNSSRMKLAYGREATFGGALFAAKLANLNFTSETLGQDSRTISSNTVRSDRQTIDIIRNGVSASGDLNFELQYGGHDELLQSMFMAATLSTLVDVTASLSMGAGGTLDRLTGSFVTDGFLLGQWIRVTGFANVTNNGYFQIGSVSATSIQLSNNAGVVTEAPTSVRVVQGVSWTNGTTLSSFKFEKIFEDLSAIFAVEEGMSPNTLSMAMTSDQIVTCTMGFLGKKEISGVATIGDGSNIAAATTTSFNAINHVEAILENRATYGAIGFSMQMANNLRERLQIGTLGAVSIGLGSLDASGTLRSYFATQTHLDKYRNNTPSSLGLLFEDAAGNGYVIEFPRVKYSAGRAVNPGKSQDIIADLAWQAYMHPTLGYTARMVRWAV